MPKKNHKPKRLLAIDPGAREMGIAILEGKELVYYAVKSLRQFRPESALKDALAKYLNKLIADYSIKEIVLENGWVSQLGSKLFDCCINTIKEIAKANKLPVSSYNPKTIRKIICGSGKVNKLTTARKIVSHYPELNIYLEQDKRWKELYWLNVFDAIAAGLAYLKLQMGNNSTPDSSQCAYKALSHVLACSGVEEICFQK